MNWKFTDSSNTVVFRLFPDGRCESTLVSNPDVQKWIAAGGVPDPADPLTPAQIAAAIQAAKDLTDASAAKIDALVIAVSGLSPSQIDAMVDNRFPALTATQRDYLKGLGKVVCVLARRL